MISKFKGEVTIIKRNVDTLEVVDEQTYDNIVTDYAYYQDLFSGLISFAATERAVIGMTETEVAPDIRALHIVPNTTFGSITYDAFNYQTYVPPTLIDPGYFEISYRFNPPGAGITRNIRTVYMWYASTGEYLKAYVALSPPCEQTESNYLDIVYRVKGYPGSPGTVQEFFRTKEYTEGFERVLMAQPVGSTPVRGAPVRLSYPQIVAAGPDQQYYKGTNHFVGTQNNNPATYGTCLAWAGSYSTSYYRRYAFSLTTDNNIGWIYRSFAISNTYMVSSSHYTTDVALLRVAATPDTFAYKPVQPIHNHNTNAIEPFLDIDYLATGNGFLQVDGTGYTKNDDLPMWYRADILNTGNIGTSRYYFAQRPFAGWQGASTGVGINTSSYNNCGNANQQGMIPWFHGDDINSTRRTFGAGACDSSLNLLNKNEEYDGKKIVTFSSTQIVLVDIITGEFQIFDSTTLPTLAISSIYQVAVDNNLDIWVSCPSTGLWKIQDPLGTPSVVHYTQGLHGIPADGGCYGVCEGYNNSIWAIFNDGLSRTDNYGTTWTNYNPTSSPAFSFTGITDGNWSNVRMIRADRATSDHQIGLLYGIPSNATIGRAHIAWWSTAGTSYTGPGSATSPSTEILGILETDMGTPLTSWWRCSLNGNLWSIQTAYSASRINFYRYIQRFASNAHTRIGEYQTSPQPPNGVIFLYDQHNQPYTIGTDSTYARGCLVNYDGYKWTYPLAFGEAPTSTTGGVGFAYAPEKSANRGWIIKRAKPASASHLTGDAAVIDFLQQQETGGVAIDSWNHKHSPYSEFCWKVYRWNGSAWELYYNQPATDSSTYNRAGTRKGFHTENHYFTGRSRLALPSTVLTGNFTNTFTFAATITPAAKLLTQENNAILLDIRNGTTTNPLLTLFWKRNDSGNKLSVGKSDGTFQNLITTPADGSTYRIVVTVNGTTAKVYSNGAQVGSNITLPSSLDLSNGTTTQVAVGAHTVRSTAFFRGDITNVQLWNVEWDTTDIANDNGNPSGVISSKPIGNMHCRYQLNQTIVETRPTHSGYVSFTDGLQLKFTSDGNTPDFVNGDYYTFACVDGIVKDNATAFSYQYDLYLKPVHHEFDNIEDTINAPGNMTPTISSSGGQITEPLLFRRATTTFGACATTGRLWPNAIGQLASTENASTACWITAVGFQNITGNGYIEFKQAYVKFPGTSGFSVGLAINSNFEVTDASCPYQMRFLNTGSFTVRENGATPVYTGTYAAKDKFKINRTGTSVTFYQNDVLIYTALSPSTGTLYPRVYSTTSNGSYYYAIYDVKINYTRPGYFLDLGNSVTLTGKYDEDYLMFVGESSTVTATIGGIPAVVNVIRTRENFMNTLPVPNAGELVIEPYTGLVKCSSADVGKAVTIKISLLKDK